MTRLSERVRKLEGNEVEVGLAPEGAAYHVGERDPVLIMRALGLDHLERAVMGISEGGEATEGVPVLVHAPTLRAGMTREFYRFSTEHCKLCARGQGWSFFWQAGGTGWILEPWNPSAFREYDCRGAVQ